MKTILPRKPVAMRRFHGIIRDETAGSESVALEILSIVGWVAVWETANILIIERHDLQYSKKNMDRIINSEIVFQKTNTP